jgi:PKD repeat protein
MKNMKYRFYLTTLLLGVSVFFAEAQDQVKVIRCETVKYMNEVQNKDPQFLINQAELERQTAEYVSSLNSNKSTNAAANQRVKRIIPIVFHVFHNGGPENISKQRILEQVEILNRDFQRLNADTNETNPIYKSIAADCDIEFRLAKLDPNGNCTDGIVRVKTDLTYNADDNIKALSRWPNNKYFNVWVVETISTTQVGGVVLGRSQFPGGSNTTDGVLLKATVTGNTTTFSNYGRTLTHEIGHSLNLRHIWGDATCGNDFVADTPPHNGANSGCPNNRVSTCVTGNVIEMTENYMDYTNGVCQNMFSEGQKTRMEAVWNSTTNGRNNLYSSSNLVATGTNDGYVATSCTPIADFNRKQEICSGTVAAFIDGSFNTDVIAWEWTFEGGTPSTSTAQNPSISYPTAGRFDVKLKVTSAGGVDSVLKSDYIRVFESISTKVPPFTLDMEDASLFNNNAVNAGGNKKNWELVTNAGFSSSSSLAMKFFGISDGQSNDVLLPTINFKGTTAPKLTFNYAYARRTTLSNDNLTLGFSRNCGVSFSNLFNKSGSALATTTNSTSSFIPSSDAQWTTVEVLLDAYTNEDNAYIRFRATNDGPGSNIYIDNIVFTVATGIDNFLANNLNLTIAPNPFENSTNVKFYLVQDADVQITLLDLLGREVKTLNAATLNAGDHNIELNTNNEINTGIYLLKVRVNGIEKVEKVIIK